VARLAIWLATGGITRVGVDSKPERPQCYVF
jgi:hypothetical protein